MLIRVRTNIGIWRVDGLDAATATPASVLAGIASSRPHVEYEAPLCSDPGCGAPLDEARTLAEQGLGHGGMIHARVNPETCAEEASGAAAGTDGGDSAGAASPAAAAAPGGGGAMRRVVGKDGSIRLVPADDGTGGAGEGRGFRKGMMALRDMKMQWTLQEFTAMDDQYVFKVKRQEESYVGKGGCSLDSPSVNDFQSYLRLFNFQRQRFGFLYGRFVDDDNGDGDGDADAKDGKAAEADSSTPKKQSVVVEAIYEPPQEADPSSPEGFVALDDPMEERVEAMAAQMGLRRVGWVLGHPPREDGFQLSAAEIIMAAELQLEAGGGLDDPCPFVTVKVTVGDDGNASVEAFQVSRQCMEMVAEEALETGPNPGFCYVNETFTAIQEGKPSKTVENNFFLCLVPIRQHTSEMLVSDFPKANRDHDDRAQSKDEMKKQLSKSGRAGWTFIDVLSDFSLLVYLSQFLDAEADMPKILASVADRDVPLDDGYKILISSIAGLDGSY